MTQDLTVRSSFPPRTAPSPPPRAEVPPVPLEAPEAFLNRELSWLAFARRVLALVEQPDVPLLERVKFAGISGMLHDEFFMKRMSGLKRQIRKRSSKRTVDGRTPPEEFDACRQELADQVQRIGAVLAHELRPALAGEGLGIHEYATLAAHQQAGLRAYFHQSVLPILTPLAVDPEHPFPFISSLGLNLAILLGGDERSRQRFVRLKVPDNRPRWVPVPGGGGVTPLEQVIAHNLDLLYPGTTIHGTYVFRVTRGAEGNLDAEAAHDDAFEAPGSIIELVSRELKARRFAGIVRLQVDAAMPDGVREWLARQLGIDAEDVYPATALIGLNDLLQFPDADRPELRYPAHKPVTHARLRGLDADPAAVFAQIARGDILLHHPYHGFDSSVLRFLEAAAADPAVLAIKVTIYRTSSDSPIVNALAEAARRGKQVAVLVEITARFDEAPNIAWGKFLENEGVHVAYGVERLKTHVKLALVVREEAGQLRQYAHIGTGNYHPGTAKVYEDLGLLTADAVICAEVAAVFNGLTGTTEYPEDGRMLIAPGSMRRQFTELIQREAKHAQAGRPSGIRAKMNQLQDPEIIRELYRASLADVPISLNVRGLCCLRPGVPGLSPTIRVFSVVGRFLEHSRVFRFENGGDPEVYLGSADWMHRNLSSRIETVVPVLDPAIRAELDAILDVYEQDNCSAWDCGPDGVYTRRTPDAGAPRLAAQERFLERLKR